MENVRLRIQVDFGVGDVIVPGPRMIEYPVFLGGDTIALLAYPVETSIAEKLQAMVALGDANSRMKDQATFANRATDMQWNAFVKKIGEGTLANRFGEVIEDLRKFAIPMFRYIALREKIGKQWRAGKRWLAD